MTFDELLFLPSVEMCVLPGIRYLVACRHAACPSSGWHFGEVRQASELRGDSPKLSNEYQLSVVHPHQTRRFRVGYHPCKPSREQKRTYHRV